MIGDRVDYESVISEKFPDCDVEVMAPDVFEIERLVEYITDDIVIYRPHSVMIYRHMVRFLMDDGVRGKIYYLDGFSDDELKIIHSGLLKFTWKENVIVNLFKNADPDRDVLGL